jgi:hypothetical protein
MQERTLITIEMIRNEGVIMSESSKAIASVTSFATFVDTLDTFCVFITLVTIFAIACSSIFSRYASSLYGN